MFMQSKDVFGDRYSADHARCFGRTSDRIVGFVHHGTAC